MELSHAEKVGALVGWLVVGVIGYFIGALWLWIPGAVLESYVGYRIVVSGGPSSGC
jgi:hypothetical protein